MGMPELLPVGPLTSHEGTHEREDSFRHPPDPEPLKPFHYSSCQEKTSLLFSPVLPPHHPTCRGVRGVELSRGG